MKKKYLLFTLLLTFFLSCFSALASCSIKKNNNVKLENGSYYCEVVDANDYTITIENEQFTLAKDGVSYTGSYQNDGKAITFNFKDKNQQAMKGSVNAENTILTLKQGTEDYVFYKNVNYTVNYDSNNGSQVETKQVLNGKTAVEPQNDPVLDNKIFVGWYEEKDQNLQRYNFNERVLSNKTLYARYVDRLYNEEFNVKYMNGEQEVKTELTANNRIYNLPTLQAEGKTFLGWWVSDFNNKDELTSQFIEASADDTKVGTLVNTHTTLYAVWEEDGMAISVKKDVINWTASKTAQYNVTITNEKGQEVHKTKTPLQSTEYKGFNFDTVEAGKYVISVTVGGKTTQAYYNNKTLVAPIYLDIKDYVFTFNPIRDAEGYVLTIKCGSATHKETDKQINLGTRTAYDFNESGCEMCEGGITFTVSAVKNGYVSGVSETYTFEQTLNNVENVKYDTENDIVTWDAVENATSYDITIINGTETYKYTCQPNECQIDVGHIAGDFTVNVKAVNKLYNSTNKELSFQDNRVAKPTNVVLNNKTISWKQIDGAVSYVIKIGDKEYTSNTNSYTINDTEFVKANVTDYNIEVKAIASEVERNSRFSAPLAFVYNANVKNVTYNRNTVSWTPVFGVAEYTIKVNEDYEMPVTDGVTAKEITLTRGGQNKIVVCYENNGEATQEEITVVAHTISFNVAGGNEIEDKYYQIGDIVKLDETTRGGYTFDYWADENNNLVNEERAYVVQGNATITAYWTANEFVVLLDGDTTIQEYELVGETEYNITFGEKFAMPVPTTTDTTKVFAGWVRGTQKLTDEKGNSLAGWNVFDLNYDSNEDGENDCVLIKPSWYEVFTFELVTDKTQGDSYSAKAGPGISFVSTVTIPGYYKSATDEESKPVITVGSFAGVNNIRVFNIPDTIKNINIGLKGGNNAGSAFQNCNNLEAINVFKVEDPSGKQHEVKYTSFSNSLYEVVMDTDGINVKSYNLLFVPIHQNGEYQIADKTDTIAPYAFAGTNVNKIVVPHTVSYLSQNAFANCVSLREIEFLEAPEGVNEISLKMYKKTDGKYELFTDSTNIRKLTFPARIEELPVDFLDTLYISLVDIEIVGQPLATATTKYSSENGVLFATVDGVKTLTYYPRQKTDTSYEIPVGTNKIGEKAFGSTSVNYNKYLTQTITIPAFVEEIGRSAFYYVKMTNLVFEGGADDKPLSIRERAFYYCNKISSVVLPANLKVVEKAAFGYTTMLTEVTLTTAGFTKNDLNYAVGAFASTTDSGSIGTYYVSKLNIGADVPEFEVAGVFGNAKLTNINVDAENRSFSSVDGILFNYEKTSIILFPLMRGGQYVVPNTVTEIGGGVFANNKLISKITIGSGVTKIGAGAFNGCASLNTVIFEESADLDATLVIEDMAFYSCSMLSSIELPSRTTQIGDLAFYYCSTLTEITLPRKLVKLGGYVEKEVKLHGSETNVTKDVLYSMNVFMGCSSLETITVEEGNTMFASLDGILYSKAFVDFTADYSSPNSTSTSEGLYAQKSSVQVVGDYFDESDNTLKVLLFVPRANKGDENRVVSVPKSVMKIADLAFYYNGNSLSTGGINELKWEDNEVVNANGNKLILGVRAFSYSYSLKKITLPEGVEEIPDRCFYYTYYLKEIVIPTTVTKISGDRTFYYANALQTINFIEGGTNALVVEDSEDGVNGAFCNTKNLKTITFPERTTKIGLYAFTSSAIVEVNLPTTITTINDYAFYVGETTSKLTTVNFKDNLPVMIDKTKVLTPVVSQVYYTYNSANEEYEVATDITEWAEGVDYYVMQQSRLSYIGEYAFQNSLIETLVLPSNISELGIHSLSNMTALKTIVIPSNVITIGEEAFANDMALETVNFTNGLTTIGKRAFTGCAMLNTLVFPQTLEIIGENAFEDNGSLKNVTLNVGLKTIDTQAFYNCSEIETIEIPYTVEAINREAFWKAIKLNTITFAVDETTQKSNLKIIGEYAFQDTVITSFVFPEAVSEITFSGDVSIFYDCKELASVELSSSVHSIDSLFANCKPNQVIIAEDNEYLASNDNFNAITSKDGTEIYYVFGTLTGDIEFTGIVKIGGNTYKDQTGITSVKFFDCISEIGDNAFYNCTGLTNVVIGVGSTLSQVGKYAFARTGIKNITIPQSVQKLGEYAFAESKLETVKVYSTFIGANDVFGNYAFSNCDSLINVELVEGLKEIPSFAFYSCNNLVKVGVAGNDTQLPTTLEIIGESAFSNCVSLEAITLPSGLKELGTSAFLSTKALKTIEIPANITTYGGFVFQGSGLETVTFASGITNLNSQYIFSRTKNLKSITLPSTVTAYANHMFWESGLESVDLSNLTTLGTGDTAAHNMFNGCDKLVSAVVPALTEYPTYLFYKCTLLSNVTFASGFTTFNGADYMFSSCSALENVVLPKVDKFANYMFYESGIKTITFDAEQTNLGTGETEGYYLFAYSDLETLVIPNKVTSIGSHAIYHCDNLTNLTLSETMEEYGDYALAYNGSLIEVENPSKLQRIVFPAAVKKLGKFAVAGWPNLKEIVFTSTGEGEDETWNLTELSDSCFRFCTGLETFVLPNTVTKIDKYAFAFTRSLSAIELPEELVELGDHAFYDSGIESIVIPEKITRIDNYLFAYTKKLTTVTLHDKVESIGDNAFYNAIALKTIEIPNGLKTISYQAFGNSALKEIVLPASLDALGTHVFYCCADLEKVTFEPTVNGEEKTWKIENLPEYTFYKVGNLKELNLPGTLKSIGNNAFEYCGIERLELPSSITAIGNLAMSFANIKEVILPKKLESLGTNVFENSKVEIVEFTADDDGSYYITEIPTNSFYSATMLQAITIPYSVQKIATNAFNNTLALETVEFGVDENGDNYLTAIENNCFYYSGIRSVVLPKNLCELGTGIDYYLGYAFANCSRLTSVEFLADKVELLETYSFFNCPLLETVKMKKVGVLKDSVFNTLPSLKMTELTADKIGNYTFKDCKNITEMTLNIADTSNNPNNVFAGCVGLEKVVLSSSFTVIPNSMFEGCRSLKDVEFYGNVIEVMEKAFYGCTSLEDIDLGNTVVSFGNYAFAYTAISEFKLPASIQNLGFYTFEGCDNLTNVIAPAGTSYVTTEQNILYDSATNLIIWCPSNVSGKIVIEEGFNIGSYAFAGCNAITEVVISEGVETIPANAFENCTALTKITLPESLKKIEANAFKGCENLAVINVPDSLESIGNYAFNNCSSLEEFNFSSSLTSIGTYSFQYSGLKEADLSNTKLTALPNYAFQGSANLENVVLSTTITTIGTYVFSNCPLITEIELHEGLLKIGNYAFNGANLTSISLPSTLTDAGSNSYTTITSATIANGTKTIPNYAFHNCTQLTTVNIPSSITKIGKYAFTNCTMIDGLNVGSNVVEIGQQAFAGAKIEGTIYFEKVTKLGKSAFKGALIDELVVTTNLTLDATSTSYGPFDSSTLKKVTFLEGVTSIYQYMFYKAYYLSSVTLPSTLTTIQKQAFEYSTGLYKITIPQSVTKIDSYAFRYCYKLLEVTNLSSINITKGTGNGYVAYYVLDNNHIFKSVATTGSSFVKVNDYVFYDNGTNYDLVAYEGTSEHLITPDNVNGKTYSIYKYAFYYNNKVNSVIFGDGVTGIGAYAFNYAKGLENVTFNENLTTINNYAFQHADNLKNVDFCEGLKTIGSYAFSYTILTEVVLPSTVEVMDARTNSNISASTSSSAFNYCKVLTKIDLSKTKITLIASSTFYGCEALKEVLLPSTVTIIGNSAFYNCLTLDNIDLHEGIVEIGSNAFLGTKLYSVTLPSTLTTVGPSAFSTTYNLYEMINKSSLNVVAGSIYGTNLKNIVNDQQDSKIINVGDYVFFMDDTDANNVVYKLVAYKGTDTELVLPTNVNGNSYVISNYAFRYMNNVTSITINGGVTEIEAYAFANMKTLKTVVLGEGLVTIGDHAFYNVSTLESITLPKSLREIRGYAFSGCTKVKSIVIPKDAIVTDTYAFSGWVAGQTIYLEESKEFVQSNFVNNWITATQTVNVVYDYVEEVE